MSYVHAHRTLSLPELTCPPSFSTYLSLPSLEKKKLCECLLQVVASLMANTRSYSGTSLSRNDWDHQICPYYRGYLYMEVKNMCLNEYRGLYGRLD